MSTRATTFGTVSDATADREAQLSTVPDGSDSNVGSSKMPAGNPGNPYAYTFGSGTASGPNLFSPANYGASNVGNANSNGTHSPVTLTLGAIDGENGAGNMGDQSTPGFLLSGAELIFGTDVGTFSLGSVPAGTYDLYLYGANYDGTRGAAFTVSSGTPLGGFTSTTNPNANPAGPLTSYVLGGDYVEFINVTPTAGVISGTWSAVSNPISGLSGEGDFNGLQLGQRGAGSRASLSRTCRCGRSRTAGSPSASDCLKADLACHVLTKRAAPDH